MIEWNIKIKNTDCPDRYRRYAGSINYCYKIGMKECNLNKCPKRVK